MRVIFLALVLVFLSAPAMASDTLVMKSGEHKKGTVIYKGEEELRFRNDSDGKVVGIPLSDIAIIDAAANPVKKKGSVGFFSESNKPVYEKKTESQDVGPTANQPASTPAPPVGIKDIFNPFKLLEKTQATVKAANDKTHEDEKRMEDMKKMLEQQ